MTTRLQGITWGHTRGLLPMLATAQRFREIHPDVQIEWEVRSLQDFSAASPATLANNYDLMVIDHPSCGEAAEEGILTPLGDWIDADFLADQADNSVGSSWESYRFGSRQWALAIDAATPISGWRPDLLDHLNLSPPTTWDSLLELAKRGLVAVPGVPIDSLMHFYMFCIGLGEIPLAHSKRVVDEEVGVRALETQRQIMLLCDPRCFSMNPIAVWEWMTGEDTVAYCPFAYGYSNYSRAGYAKTVLTTGGLIRLENGIPLRSTLGGAGLAIAAACPHKETAAEYARYVAGQACQTGLYFDSGGQPGHRAAWTDAEVNRRSNGFFSNTLSTMEDAYLRPRFHGYFEFQERASLLVYHYLRGGESARACVSALNQLLPACKRKGPVYCA